MALVGVLAFALGLIGSHGASDSVHISVMEEPLVSDHWIVPLTAAGRPPPAGDCGEEELLRRRHWLEEQGGVQAMSSFRRIEVVNDSDSTLLVEGLWPSDVERLPAAQGTDYPLCPRGGGGAVEEQYVAVDLARKPLQFTFFNKNYEHVNAVDFSPAPHHPLRFWIVSSASRDRYCWRTTLSYLLDGQSYKVEIPEGSHPFDITSVRAAG